jgi:hypothetical protein
MSTIEIAVAVFFLIDAVGVLSRHAKRSEKQASRNQLIETLRKTHVADDQVELLRAEREQILWIRTKNRITSALFFVCVTAIVVVVEFDRPAAPKSYAFTQRQLFAALALSLLYSVVVHLAQHMPGKTQFRWWPDVSYGGISFELIDRLEELDALVAAYKAQHEARLS